MLLPEDEAIVLLSLLVEFIDEPEFIEPDAPMLPELVAAVLPEYEPCAAAPPLPPGVPVVPIGV
ncbi:MAG: hypothetical protein ACHP7E_10825, partial [Burkholderiales bacterium]